MGIVVDIHQLDVDYQCRSGRDFAGTAVALGERWGHGDAAAASRAHEHQAI